MLAYDLPYLWCQWTRSLGAWPQADGAGRAIYRIKPTITRAQEPRDGSWTGDRGGGAASHRSSILLGVPRINRKPLPWLAGSIQGIPEPQTAKGSSIGRGAADGNSVQSRWSPWAVFGSIRREFVDSRSDSHGVFMPRSRNMTHAIVHMSDCNAVGR